MKTALRTACRALLLAVVALLILLGVVLAMVRAASPLASVYRGELETLLGDSLSIPVRIGEVDIRWRGWQPRAILRDVALVDADGGAEPLRLGELSIDFHWLQALFTEHPQIADIRLRDAQIVLRREPDGGVSLRGLRADGADDTAMADGAQALLSLVGRIDLPDASIVFEDAIHGVEYVFPRADINIENTGRRHRVYARVDLPEVLGERLEVHLDLVGSLADVRSWRGSFHLVGRALQLAEFIEWVPDSPIALHSGVANASLWGEWTAGKLQMLSANVQLERLVLLGGARTGDARANTWDIDNASARAHWQRSGSGWELTLGDIDIAHADQRWTPTGVRMAARENARGEMLIVGGGRELPVAEAMAVALNGTRGDPIGGSLADTLRAMRPRGELKNWQFEYNAALAVPGGVKLAGEFTGLSYRAVRDIPGVDGLRGAFRLVGETLELDVSATDVEVDAVSLFREPIQLRRLAGRAQVRFLANGVRVDSGGMVVENDDLKSRVRFAIESLDGVPLAMNIEADFRDGHGRNTSAYLPVGIMDDDLVEWLDQAVVGGTIVRGTLSLRGNTEDFPYTGGGGLFEVECDVSDATLKYHPDWPVVSGVTAQLHFLGSSLSVRASRGEVHTSRIRQVVARIADFDQPVIEVEGKIDTHVPELLHFAINGPLSDFLYTSLKPLSGRGEAHVALSLRLPIGEGSPALALNGAITLEDANFHHESIDTPLSRVSGTIGFNRHGVRIEGLRMVVLDTPLLLDARTRSDASTVIGMHGNMPVRRVLEKFGIPFGHHVSGSSHWLAELTIAKTRSRDQVGITDLWVSSDLFGTRIELPAPLAKPARTARPFSLSVRVAGPNSLEHWRVRYANIFSAVVKATWSPARAHAGAVRFGGGRAVMPDTPGFYASGELGSFDFDAWFALLREKFPDSSNESSPAPFDISLTADLQLGNLYILNTRIRDIALMIDSEDQVWRLDIDSDVASGFARVPRPLNRAAALDVHFDHFNYDSLQANHIESDRAAAALNPHSVPPFNASMTELLWQSYRLGNVKIAGRAHPRGMALDTIDIDGDFMAMRGTGLWEYRPATSEHATSLTMRFNSENLGGALADMGKGGGIGEGQGELQIELGWPGTLYSPDTESLTGMAKLSFSDGRILTVDPGTGRLVGLLALQQLPRRLLLDFGDAIDEGMAFDSIEGEIRIAGGTARTELLRMRGPIGIIDARGGSNLVDQTYDYTIAVLPRLGATLPLIGVLSGGLAAGATLFLAEGILSKLGIDIDKLGRREYTLTGSWDDPTFEQIN